MQLLSRARPLGFLAVLLLAGPPSPAAAQAPPIPPAKQHRLDSLATVARQPNRPDSVRISTAFEQALTWRRLNLDSAERYCTASLTLARTAARPRQEAVALGLLGALTKDRGNFPGALQQQLQALRINERIGSRSQQCINHNDLGILYKNLRQWPAAQQHYTQSLALAEELVQLPGPKQGFYAGAIAYTLNNLGTVAFEQAHYAEAQPFYERALAQARRVGNVDAEATALTNLGGLYAETKRYGPAATYFRQGLDIDVREGNVYGEISDRVTLGEMYIFLRRFPAADSNLTRALTLARTNGILPMEKEAQLRLARLYHAQGDANRAYAAQVAYTALADSLFSTESAEKMAEMQTRFDTEKKEQQNRVQALQLAQQQLIIRKRNVQLGAVLLGVLAALLIGGLLRSRARARQRLLLAEEKQRQQQERAAAIIEAEEHERRRIGADLHDGVGQLLAAAKINLSGLQHELALTERGQQDRFAAALDVLDESAREVRSLSHQLVPNALLRRGLVAAVREFVEKMGGAAAGLRVELEVLGLDRRLPETVEAVLYRAIQEVVANVVKHARATAVTVQLLGQADELTVLIEDNGIGFDMAAAQASATAGIGLRNLFSRVEYLGGQLHIDSRPGRGTSVTIEVPLAAENPPVPIAA